MNETPTTPYYQLTRAVKDAAAQPIEAYFPKPADGQSYQSGINVNNFTAWILTPYSDNPKLRPENFESIQATNDAHLVGLMIEDDFVHTTLRKMFLDVRCLQLQETANLPSSNRLVEIRRSCT